MISTIPKWGELFATILPRPALRWLEIHATFSNPLCPAALQGVPPLRVAVVKSEMASHIYTRPGSSADLLSLVLSTPKMIGPTAFFTLFKTDFLIVKVSSDPECQHWRESFSQDPDPSTSIRFYEAHRDLRPQAGPNPYLSQSQVAIDPDSIQWSQYDCVICHDLAIPARIVAKYPKVFWSYWIGETGTPSYKASYQDPLAGYQCFLNGGSRRWRVRPQLKSHVVEFPFIFQQPSDHFLLGARPSVTRSGVLLERITSQKMPPDTRLSINESIEVVPTSDLSSERLQKLHSARYFLQMGGQPVWGNSFQEAVSAGCLAIADPSTMPNNRSLMLPELAPKTWNQAITLVKKLEQDPEWRENLRQQQESLASWFLCHRPLRDWLARYRHFREARGQ
jgi:hypothetical protein